VYLQSEVLNHATTHSLDRCVSLNKQSYMNKKKTIEKNSREIRGGILNSALEVENALNESIGLLYADRKNEFSHFRLVEDIIADLTCEKKIKSLKKNINYESGIFKKYTSIISGLHDSRETRNQIAHRNISFPWIFGEDDIDENDFNFLTKEYVDWKEKCDFGKPGRDDFTFTLEDLKNYQKKCELIIIVLRVGIPELL